MNTQHKPRRCSPVTEQFWSLIRLVGAASFPQRLVPVRALSPPWSASLRVSSRWPTGRIFLLLLIMVAAIPAWASQSALPAGVPNVFDPEVRARFQPVGMANLKGNPDFPVLILQNMAGEQPQVMLLGLDARNGKETWSLASDPIILIVLFADPETILGAHVDAGFAERGRPSGQFMTLADPTSPGLSDLLRSITLTATRTYM